MVEAQTNKVRIEDVDAETFKGLLKYVYCAQFPDVSAIKLMPLADQYDLPELKEACVHAMERGLTKLNVCETLIAAELHHCADLGKKCLEALGRWKATVDDEQLNALSQFPKLLFELVRMG